MSSRRRHRCSVGQTRGSLNTSCFHLLLLWPVWRLYLAGWAVVILHGAASSGPSDAVARDRRAFQDASAEARNAPIVDLNSYLVDRDVFFQRLPAGYVQNRRIEDQAKLLETYKKDPEGFLKGYQLRNGLSFSMPSSTPRTWSGSGRSATAGNG